MPDQNANGTRGRSDITPGRESAPPVRTIEDIERRAAEVLEAEKQALAAIAACLREVAVRLPPDSQMPLKLAKAAQALAHNDYCDPATRVWRTFYLLDVIDQHMPEAGA